VALGSKRLTLSVNDLKAVLKAPQEAPTHMAMLIEYASKTLP
jgi:hypothetical protein